MLASQGLGGAEINPPNQFDGGQDPSRQPPHATLAGVGGMASPSQPPRQPGVDETPRLFGSRPFVARRPPTRPSEQSTEKPQAVAPIVRLSGAILRVPPAGGDDQSQCEVAERGCGFP
jgi:hypothetical protein